MKFLKMLFRLNYLKTIYLNFRLLSFSKAVHFPILLFGKVDLVVGANASIELSKPLKMGMLRFGVPIDPINRPLGRSVFIILGKLIVGNYIVVNPKSVLNIKRYGTLEIGDSVYIGPSTKIVATNRITIQSTTRISWECQIFDTDFHYLLNSENSEIRMNSKPVFIGKSCWIGNRVTINKNTKLPDYSVVASNSLVNKDFGDNGQCIIGGIPARVLKTGLKRIFNLNTEQMLDDFFASSHASAYTLE